MTTLSNIVKPFTSPSNGSFDYSHVSEFIHETQLPEVIICPKYHRIYARNPTNKEGHENNWGYLECLNESMQLVWKQSTDTSKPCPYIFELGTHASNQVPLYKVFKKNIYYTPVPKTSSGLNYTIMVRDNDDFYYTNYISEVDETLLVDKVLHSLESFTNLFNLETCEDMMIHNNWDSVYPWTTENNNDEWSLPDLDEAEMGNIDAETYYQTEEDHIRGTMDILGDDSEKQNNLTVADGIAVEGPGPEQSGSEYTESECSEYTGSEQSGSEYTDSVYSESECSKPEPVRFDELYGGWNTEHEFKEYYGKNCVWNQMNPKKLVMRNAICFAYNFGSHLPEQLQNKFIKEYMKTYA